MQKIMLLLFVLNSLSPLPCHAAEESNADAAKRLDCIEGMSAREIRRAFDVPSDAGAVYDRARKALHELNPKYGMCYRPATRELIVLHSQSEESSSGEMRRSAVQSVLHANNEHEVWQLHVWKTLPSGEKVIKFVDTWSRRPAPTALPRYFSDIQLPGPEKEMMFPRKDDTPESLVSRWLNGSQKKKDEDFAAQNNRWFGVRPEN